MVLEKTNLANHVKGSKFASVLINANTTILYTHSVHEDNVDYGGNMDAMKNRVTVYHTGAMFWIVPLVIKAHCEIHVNQFPFDVQKCKLVFGSWTYPLHAIDLHFDGGIDICKFIIYSLYI